MLFVSRTTSQWQTQNLMAVKAEENRFIPTVLSEKKSSWTEPFAKTPSTVDDSTANAPSTVDKKSFCNSRTVNMPFTIDEEDISSAGVDHTAVVDARSMRSFFVNLALIEEPEAPLSSGRLPVMGFGFPKRALNLAKVTGLRSFSE